MQVTRLSGDSLSRTCRNAASCMMRLSAAQISNRLSRLATQFCGLPCHYDLPIHGLDFASPFALFSVNTIFIILKSSTDVIIICITQYHNPVFPFMCCNGDQKSICFFSLVVS